MAKWYATFGNGYSLRNNFVVIEGNGYEDVSRQMNDFYGSKWACLYAEGAWNTQRQVEEFGLSEVPFGTPNVYAPGRPQLEMVDPPVDPVVGGGFADYSNEFEVQRLAAGSQLLIHRGPVGPLNRYQALCLAAWLVKLALKLPGQTKFSDVVRNVFKKEA